MIGFFRNIRRKLANENKVLHYSRYAVGEIVLVMVGILLALQVNNWNVKRIDMQNELAQVGQLLEDARADSVFFTSRAKFYQKYDSVQSALLNLYVPEMQDSISKLKRMEESPFGTRLAHQSNVVTNNNEVFDIISNSDIKKHLRKYIAKYEYVRTAIELSNRMNETYGIPLAIKYSEEIKIINSDSTMVGYLGLIENKEIRPNIENLLNYNKNASFQVDEFNKLNHEFIAALEIFLRNN